MWSFCCCRETNPKADEVIGKAQELVGLKSDDLTQESTPKESTPAPPPEEISQKNAPPESTKEKEKERLQLLVREFAKAAYEGIGVKIFDCRSRETLTSKFKMERYLRWFTLSPTAKEDICLYQMKDITLISKNSTEMGQLCCELPVNLLSHTCMIEVVPSDSPLTPAIADDTTRCMSKEQLIIVFEDSIYRERFYTCMKILRMSVDISKQRHKKTET
eukprot:GHVO01050941.1.p1 GENE.GHVO01050941.1~~GHVO01050941.1.p1  ORF type:complete len:218 (+),score=37.59 GHVO01050941.1:36-689(+)